MSIHPIKEQLLLESLPGFEELTKEEKERTTIVKFEYRNLPLYYSCSVTFDYDQHRLIFHLMGSQNKDLWFSDITYLSIDDMQFPNFREAIDFFNKQTNP
jgi:hypothetical protein